MGGRINYTHTRIMRYGTYEVMHGKMKKPLKEVVGDFWELQESKPAGTYLRKKKGQANPDVLKAALRLKPGERMHLCIKLLSSVDPIQRSLVVRYLKHSD